MSDTLVKMEEDLQRYKLAYKKCKDFFSLKNSMGGIEVTKQEQYTLDWLEGAIHKFEREIEQRKDLLSRIDILGVWMEYVNLHGRIDAIYNNSNETYKKWKKYLYSVGTCYKNAHNRFKEIVNAQNKYKEDLDAIGGSILSVVGMGTLAWVSTTGQILSIIGDKYEDVVNIGEDVTQGLWDKSVSYAASKMASVEGGNIDVPTVFYNNISEKALDGCLDILEVISKCIGVVNGCQEKLSELRKGINGTTKATDEAKKQYEIYIKQEASIVKVMLSANKWIKELPPKINTKELEKDFERVFWAAWLPRLESTEITGYEFGMDIGEVDYHEYSSFDAWLSNDLTNKLDVLIDLKKIGVGEDGLNRWVSQNDVKLLIKWANNFEPQYTF